MTGIVDSPKSAITKERQFPDVTFLKKLLADRKHAYTKYQNDCIDYRAAVITETIINELEQRVYGNTDPQKHVVHQKFCRTWDNECNKHIVMSVYALLEPDFAVSLDKCTPFCCIRPYDAVLTVALKPPTYVYYSK